jgi:hypothetical protein
MGETMWFRASHNLYDVTMTAIRSKRQFTRRETIVRISFDARPSTDKPSTRHEASSLDSFITQGKYRRGETCRILTRASDSRRVNPA